VRYLAGLVSLVSLALSAAIAAPGCSNSSEGQPCSTLGVNAGDSECKNGLVCTPFNELNGGGYTKDVCCPADRTQATTLICMEPQSPAPDAGPFPDVGMSTDAEPDVAADTQIGDGPVADGPTDAHTPSDGHTDDEGG